MLTPLFNFLKRKKFDENRFETLIDRRVSIKGDITYCGNTVINGEVVGSIIAKYLYEPGGILTAITSSSPDCTASLIINGKVHGDITGDFIVINGDVDGDITATSKLFIKAKGRVAGNITYKAIKIEEGAVITGTFKILDQEVKVPVETDSVSTEAAPAKKHVEAIAKHLMR